MTSEAGQPHTPQFSDDSAVDKVLRGLEGTPQRDGVVHDLGVESVAQVVEVGVSQRDVIRITDSYLLAPVLDLQKTFDGQGSVEATDSDLLRLKYEVSKLDDADPATRLSRDIALAVVEGGTRHRDTQGQRPFSDMIQADAEIDHDVKKRILGMADNKTGFIRTNQHETLLPQDTHDLNSGMRKQLENMMGDLQEEDITQADKRALALAIVFATTASAETTSMLSVNELVEGVIAPALANEEK